MRVGSTLAALALLIGCTTTALAQDGKEAPAPSAAAKADAKQAELEKKFSELLTNAELVGTFTVTGKEDKAPKSDRYTLVSCTKLDGDMWLFTAKMKGNNIPMPLQVKWAGDTPVITMTETTIPGMGTFTCRVLFYEDHYIGYWRHGEVRGGMSGVIEKAKPAGEKAAEKPTEKAVEKSSEKAADAPAKQP